MEIKVAKHFFDEWMAFNDHGTHIGTGKLVRYGRGAVAVVELTEDELKGVVYDANLIVENGPKDGLTGDLYKGAARTLDLLEAK